MKHAIKLFQKITNKLLEDEKLNPIQNLKSNLFETNSNPLKIK